MALPNEVLLLVFEFLGVRYLASCASAQWTGLAATNTVWLAHFHRAYVVSAPPLVVLFVIVVILFDAVIVVFAVVYARQAGVVDWKRELRGA
jgi:hypothetical protein